MLDRFFCNKSWPVAYFSINFFFFCNACRVWWLYFSKLLLFCLRIKGCDITGSLCLHSKQVNCTAHEYIPPGIHYLVADQKGKCLCKCNCLCVSGYWFRKHSSLFFSAPAETNVFISVRWKELSEIILWMRSAPFWGVIMSKCFDKSKREKGNNSRFRNALFYS
jgi:hypothetical protein